MDWRRGFSAKYYLTVLDRNTWRDISRTEILGGTIKRSATNLRESADINCANFGVGTELWVRIWLDARQDNNVEHVPLFTGLSTSPEKSINGKIVTNTLECYSVLKPAEDVLLDRGWYAPAGMSGSLIIERLLGEFPAPVKSDEFAPTLSQSIVAEDGETKLSMTEKVLKAINWRLRIDGKGIIHVCPKATDPSATFDGLNNDIVEPNISYSRDWYECPNVFRAIQNDLMGTARDDSESSMFSTTNRGREVWMEEDGCELYAGETIAEYAKRRLLEEQSVGVTVEYNRRFLPDIIPGDLVRLNYPEQGLVGVYGIEEQDISLGYGAKTSEEVSKVG